VAKLHELNTRSVSYRPRSLFPSEAINMRNEDERSMNVMRGILHACEEGATDELSDGSDGNEPWTEEDRRAARATAEWIRTTFLMPQSAEPRSKPKIRRCVGEQLWSDDQLWQQLESDDPYKRDCAMQAIDALANLAAVRARKRRTHFLIERHAVFDVLLMRADLDGNDRELHEAAVRAFSDVSHIAAIVEADTIELTEQEKQECRELHEWTLAKLAELERAAEARRNGGDS
jgi:hypothetical protein